MVYVNVLSSNKNKRVLHSYEGCRLDNYSPLKTMLYDVYTINEAAVYCMSFSACL